MGRKVYRFRRLEWGGPEHRLKVLAEGSGGQPPRHMPRRKRRLTIPSALAGLMLVSAFGAGYTSDGLSTGGLKAMLPGSGCDIKGNISIDTGERIYHLPGQKYYRQTRISLRHGERWFCSEADAREAGWRKSRQ